VAYVFEKRLSKTPEQFGHGAIEGVAAPETANNAYANAAMIPLLTLGIPSSSSACRKSCRCGRGKPRRATTQQERNFHDVVEAGRIQFVYSCYLVKHGDEYLLWDTGHAMTMPNVAPKVSLVDLLAQISVKPEQIKYVGISHYHADHTGQVSSRQSAPILQRWLAQVSRPFASRLDRQ
jgi:Tripartite tricarboxylate transporter TctA family/Metallo-beta-lactamase superfamily